MTAAIEHGTIKAALDSVHQLYAKLIASDPNGKLAQDVALWDSVTDAYWEMSRPHDAALNAWDDDAEGNDASTTPEPSKHVWVDRAPLHGLCHYLYFNERWYAEFAAIIHARFGTHHNVIATARDLVVSTGGRIGVADALGATRSN